MTKYIIYGVVQCATSVDAFMEGIAESEDNALMLMREYIESLYEDEFFSQDKDVNESENEFQYFYEDHLKYLHSDLIVEWELKNETEWRKIYIQKVEI